MTYEDITVGLPRNYFACIVFVQDGRTALHLAASYGNYEVVKILVSAFADVNNTSKVRIIPLMLQVTERERESVGIQLRPRIHPMLLYAACMLLLCHGPTQWCIGKSVWLVLRRSWVLIPAGTTMFACGFSFSLSRNCVFLLGLWMAQ